MRNLPQYRNKRHVGAAQISRVELLNGAGALLMFADPALPSITVTEAFVLAHGPAEGGWLVEDYSKALSWLPDEVFRQHYRPVAGPGPVDGSGRPVAVGDHVRSNLGNVGRVLQIIGDGGGQNARVLYITTPDGIADGERIVEPFDVVAGQPADIVHLVVVEATVSTEDLTVIG